MDRHESHLESSASQKVLWPVLGMLGGLLLGGLRAWVGGGDELAATFLVIAGGLIGSVLGMTAILAMSYRFRKTDLNSVKGLMTIVLVAALVLWFILNYVKAVLNAG